MKTVSFVKKVEIMRTILDIFVVYPGSTLLVERPTITIAFDCRTGYIFWSFISCSTSIYEISLSNK